MIDASELMIGNYLLGYNGEFQITAGDILSISEDTDHGYKYVPLSDDVLVRLGFNYKNYDDGTSSTLYKGWYSPMTKKGSIRIFSIESGYKYFSSQKDLKYVHQLQILYFILTGDKLTFSK